MPNPDPQLHPEAKGVEELETYHQILKAGPGSNTCYFSRVAMNDTSASGPHPASAPFHKRLSLFLCAASFFRDTAEIRKV